MGGDVRAFCWKRGAGAIGMSRAFTACTTSTDFPQHAGTQGMAEVLTSIVQKTSVCFDREDEGILSGETRCGHNYIFERMRSMASWASVRRLERDQRQRVSKESVSARMPDTCSGSTLLILLVMTV
jgi:hypothetical protein